MCRSEHVAHNLIDVHSAARVREELQKAEATRRASAAGAALHHVMFEALQAAKRFFCQFLDFRNRLAGSPVS